MFFLPASTGKAEASGWEWRQDDWKGGPGQALWTDNARYDVSNFVDTTSVPGTLRLSHIANPYLKEATNPVLHTGGAGAWDENLISAATRPYAGGGYEALYQAEKASAAQRDAYTSILKQGYLVDRPKGEIASMVFAQAKPSYIDMIKRLKQILDPEERLNPGQFLEGI